MVKPEVIKLSGSIGSPPDFWDHKYKDKATQPFSCSLDENVPFTPKGQIRCIHNFKNTCQAMYYWEPPVIVHINLTLSFLCGKKKRDNSSLSLTGLLSMLPWDIRQSSTRNKILMGIQPLQAMKWSCDIWKAFVYKMTPVPSYSTAHTSAFSLCCHFLLLNEATWSQGSCAVQVTAASPSIWMQFYPNYCSCKRNYLLLRIYAPWSNIPLAAPRK